MKAAFLLSLLLITVCYGSDNKNTGNNAKKLRILMASDYLFGHMAPLLPIGEELVQRGHNVTLLAMLHENQQEKCKSHVEKFGVHLWNVSSEDLPQINWTQVAQNVSKDFFGALKKLFGEDYAGILSITTKHMNNSLSNNDWDLVMTFFFFQSAVSCMRLVHNVPFVLIGSFVFSTHLHPVWPSPNILQGAVSDNMGFLNRAFNIPTNIVATALNYAMSYPMKSTLSDYCPSADIRKAMTDAGIQIPAIMQSVMGFEYTIPTTPLTEYVGPLVSRYPAPLTGKLKEWLESKPNKSVVYISMGSVFPLDQNSGRAFLEGVMKTNLSILWSLRESNQNILEDLDINPDRVLVSDWTPQFSVLQSPAIHSAILHGGMNGLSESFSSGVPVIVVPQMLEQIFNAGHVHFNGLGIHLDPKTLSNDKIAESLKALDTGNYRSKVSDLQKMYRLAGGVERAADLIEFYEDVGYDHLVPAYAKYEWSWVQYYNADVYAVILLTLVAVIMCFLACCRCLCRRCPGIGHKQKDE